MHKGRYFRHETSTLTREIDIAVFQKLLQKTTSMTKPYYYWDFAYRSKDGKTLQECFDSFGTGVQKLQLDDIIHNGSDIYSLMLNEVLRIVGFFDATLRLRA